MSTRLFKVGFATTDNPGDVVCLFASVSGSGYDTFAQETTKYQVPSGKTLYIGHFAYWINANTSGQGFTLGHGTSAVTNSGTAPTAATQITQIFDFGTSNNTYTMHTLDLVVPVAALLYPYIQASGGADGPNVNVNGLVF